MGLWPFGGKKPRGPVVIPGGGAGARGQAGGSMRISGASGTKIITCPYCFSRFPHDEVHFKAMTLKEADGWESAHDDFGVDDDDFDPFGDVNKEDENENSEDKSIARLFEEREDPLFKKFWDRYANELDWQYANYPVLTRDDPRMLGGSYRCDADGMVDSVVDFYGMETKERICPHCHNPLPPNYGKYKVHFIATVGITSSGKTVYLSQLLRRMDEYMSNVNLVTFDMTPANERFLEEHPVELDIPLPQGTAPGALSAPLFYVILDKNEYHTLVFYDVAGENCVIADEMSKYGAFIKNADGIIMILDPDQFSIVNTSRDKVVSPKAVVEAMFNSFLGSRGSGPSGIPLALALSKSDKLEGHELISPSSNIFKDIQYDERRPGFDVQQYNNLMGEVRMFLKGTSEGKSTMIAMNHCFSNTGLFAFSALNCDVKEDEKDIDGEVKKVAVPTAHPSPRRIEEPLLWLLSEFGIIPKLTQTRR